MKTELRSVLDAIEAFLDPEGKMPAETGEFNELKACIPVLQSLISSSTDKTKMGQPVTTKEQIINQMVSRLLGWRLPADFAPDAGITFKPQANPDSPAQYQYTREPTGTNLFTATQAREMFEHCIGDLDPMRRIAELEAQVSHLQAVVNTAVSFLKAT